MHHYLRAAAMFVGLAGGAWAGTYQTFVLSNEGGNGLISRLVAAGYGTVNPYQALNQLVTDANPSVAGIITPAFIQTLRYLPESSGTFTTHLGTLNTAGQAIAISTDGTVQPVNIFGATYQGAVGVSSQVSNIMGVGNARFLSGSQITSFVANGNTYSVFAIAFSGEQTFVVSNEGPNGFFSQLLAAGYGNLNPYQMLVQFVEDTNPSIANIATPKFLKTLHDLPASSPIFTMLLKNINAGTQAIAIGTDGTFHLVNILGAAFQGQPGTTTLVSALDGVGTADFVTSTSAGTPLTSFTANGTTYDVFAIGFVPTTVPLITKVANAEGEALTIAPNTWVEIKGANLAQAGHTRIWQAADFTDNLMPTALDGVSATVNGKPAYIYYISPVQVNILTPPDTVAGQAQVVLTNNGTASTPFTVQAQAESPSFFVFNGGPYVAAQHIDWSLLGPTTLYPGYTTPAKPGETIVLWANGFGSTSAAVTPGAVTQSGTLSPLPVIKIANLAATVEFAGLVAPGEFQFNVIIPAGAPDGDQPITATYAGLTTQTGTLLTIQH